MTIVPGKVVNGRIEVDVENFELPEGAQVEIYLVTDDDELTPEQHAELDESIAQIDRGEYVDGDELLAELRGRRQR